MRLATDAETMKRLKVEAEAAVAAAAELEGCVTAVAVQLAQEAEEARRRAEEARRRAEEAEERRADAVDRTARLAQLSAAASKRAEEADAALKKHNDAGDCGTVAAWEESSIAEIDVELLLETISVRAPPAKRASNVGVAGAQQASRMHGIVSAGCGLPQGGLSHEPGLRGSG